MQKYPFYQTIFQISRFTLSTLYSYCFFKLIKRCFIFQLLPLKFAKPFRR